MVATKDMVRHEAERQQIGDASASSCISMAVIISR